MAGALSLMLVGLASLSPPSRASLAEPGPAGGSVGIQLLEAPVSSRADPRAHRYIVDHVAPGTTIRRKVMVVNSARTQQRVELYPESATIDRTRFQFGAGPAINELMSWMSLEPNQLDLAPHTEAPVEVTIDVPSAASAGERYGVIWAALSPDRDSSGNIKLVHRTGVRVYLDIGSGGEPASDFSIGSLLPARSRAGIPSVGINVTNTGGRALDMAGAVSLSDGPARQRAGPFGATTGTTLAPGQSGTVTVRLPRELPNGPWKIVVALESGMVKRTVTGEITFPDAGQVGVAARLYSWVNNPWTIVGGLIVVLLGVAGFAYAVVRKARAGKARGEASPAAQE